MNLVCSNCLGVQSPRKGAYCVRIGPRHWFKTLRYRLRLHLITARNLWVPLMAPVEELPGDTDTQSKIVTNMRLSESLVLRACFLRAFPTASSGFRRRSLLIDRFYCSRAAPSSAQTCYGWKSRACDQATALALFINVCLGCIGSARCTRSFLYTASRERWNGKSQQTLLDVKPTPPMYVLNDTSSIARVADIPPRATST